MTEPNQANMSIKDYLDFYGIYRAYAMQESNLINVRLTWILTIHGFLYATYGLTLQKELEVSNRLKEVLAGDFKLPCQILTQAECFLITIACVGMAISLFGWRSIMAAQRSSHAITAVFEEKGMHAHDIEPATFGNHKKITVVKVATWNLILPHIRGGGTEANVKSGHLASRAIPLMLASSWFISILITVDVACHNWSKLCFV